MRRRPGPQNPRNLSAKMKAELAYLATEGNHGILDLTTTAALLRRGLIVNGRDEKRGYFSLTELGRQIVKELALDGGNA